MRDYVAIARQYEADVLSGAVPACRQVKQACARNQRDCARAGTEAFPFHFNDAAARSICLFAENLPYVSGRGFAEIVGYEEDETPIFKKLELQPWQIWILTTLFGWMDARDFRRFRVALILVPRKNGKSTLGAIIALYMLTADNEPGAQCFSAATTRDQAKAVAEIVWEMAKRSPQFREFYSVRMGSETTRSLSIPTKASKFQPLSADANSLDGLNVYCAIIDELHAHKTAAVWHVLDTGTSARQQPMLFAITTAGVDIGGICYQKMGYLEKILDGVTEDEAFFGTIYTIDAGDDWWDPAIARKANPNYGVSVNAEDIARKMLEARHSQDELNDKLTKHFNVWIRTAAAYVPMTHLIALGNAKLKIEDFKDCPCWIGVDLAEIRDFAAVVALFRPDEKRYVLFGRFYLPEEAIRKSPIVQMASWVAQKHIISTDGNQADYLRIEDDIVEWCDLLTDVREIDFDRALAAQMGQSLKRRFTPRLGKDTTERFVQTVPQSVEVMNPAMQMVNGLILSGHFLHDANPALMWMFSNIVVERNGKDEVYPRKAGGKDSPYKIDGPVATYTAFSRASQAEIGPKRKRRAAMAFTPGGWKPMIDPSEKGRDAPQTA